ncbi:hypothetical protein HHK36_009888 [Tetracentron sinense]|uniref:Acetyltransferase n=1 Tax=Tetracentron sinense TaxID=13715 RepID=A0A834ZGX2_TETSI|nr:hypothetical protein HHK36_009888 [Tetracentron sinense]
MATPAAVRHMSRCYIKPQSVPEGSQEPFYLTPWDLTMLSTHYIQKGLLFTKPPDTTSIAILHLLKDSLSSALLHFFPLAGRLVTQKEDDPPSYSVLLDCTISNSPGAEFIHAVADVTIAHILSPIDVAPIVTSFFALDRAVNHDGHTLPLLSIQVTELVDGIFIGCSFNHSIGDGTSFWHFFNVWSEITRAQGKCDCISRPPIYKRWFLDGHGPIINLPFSHHDDFIHRFALPPVRVRFFHFSPQSIARLKAKANQECQTSNISSFQALSALVWRSVTRARRLPSDQNTSCRLSINNRPRLNPPLSRDYFGNSIQIVVGTTTAGELLEHGLGRAAWLLHQAVANHTDSKVRVWLEKWVMSPIVYQLSGLSDPCSIMISSSPRFDMYENDFGWGKPVAVRSGYSNKVNGMVRSYPGREGGGSVDLEFCTSPVRENVHEDRTISVGLFGVGNDVCSGGANSMGPLPPPVRHSSSECLGPDCTQTLEEPILVERVSSLMVGFCGEGSGTRDCRFDSAPVLIDTSSLTCTPGVRPNEALSALNLVTADLPRSKVSKVYWAL